MSTITKLVIRVCLKQEEEIFTIQIHDRVETYGQEEGVLIIINGQVQPHIGEFVAVSQCESIINDDLHS